MTKAERTHQFIIEKASVVINKQGMAGTSISDIMKATKLAKGGIYGNFSSKDEICRDAFSFLAKNLSLTIDSVVASKETAKDKLFAMLDFYRDSLALSERGGCPLLNFAVEADDTSPVMNRHVGEAIRLFENRIGKIITHGIKTRQFSSSIDAKALATKIFVMLEGAMMICRVQKSNRHMRTITDALKKDISSIVKKKNKAFALATK